MPANRKARGHADSGPKPGPVSGPTPSPVSRSTPSPVSRSTPGPVSGPTPSPVEESAEASGKEASGKEETPIESRPHTEGKRAKIPAARRKKQHGTAYRWIVAYLPILALLFVLLGAVWVYTGFINPPAPTPAQQWTKIENKWSPPREKDRIAIATDSGDFTKQLADYTDFYTQTKGWVDAVTAISDWGVAQDDVSNFLDDSQQYISVLQQIDAAKTPYDVIAQAPGLATWDTQFASDVATITSDFALTTMSPVPSGVALPSVNPTPTPTPGPSGSAAPSGSPGATGSPAASAAPTASPAPTSSPVASGSAAPSPSSVASPTSSPS